MILTGLILTGCTYSIGIVWTCICFVQLVRHKGCDPRKLFYKKKRTVPPKCLNDPSLGTHHRIKLKEVSLHYVESGPKDGPLIVMVHGFPECWYSWRHQIQAFNSTHRVVAMDVRGYGGSDKPSGVDQYTVTKIRQDLCEFIERMNDGKQCVLLGHDWGGGISWALASHHPHLFSKVVIMNAPHPAAVLRYAMTSVDQFLKFWFSFVVNLPYIGEWYFSAADFHMLKVIYTGRRLGAHHGTFTEEDIEVYKYIFNKISDFTGPMNFIRAVTRGLTTPADFGEKVCGVPVLLLFGTRDGAVSQVPAQRSGAYAEKFKFIPIEGASHWVQQDAPKVVNNHIRDFLVE